MKEFKSSSIRLNADEFNSLMIAVAHYIVDLKRYNDDRDAAILSEYQALADHLYDDYLNPDNYEYYPDDHEIEI